LGRDSRELRPSNQYILVRVRSSCFRLVKMWWCQVRFLLRRPRRRWMDNIRMDIGEREDGVLWNGLIWLWRGDNGESCEHGNERSVSIKFSEVLCS
jgi:hypothetical protein